MRNLLIALLFAACGAEGPESSIVQTEGDAGTDAMRLGSHADATPTNDATATSDAEPECTSTNVDTPDSCNADATTASPRVCVAGHCVVCGGLYEPCCHGAERDAMCSAAENHMAGVCVLNNGELYNTAPSGTCCRNAVYNDAGVFHCVVE